MTGDNVTNGVFNGFSTATPGTYTVTAKTSITLQVGGHSIVINASGVTIDGRLFLAHQHLGVQTGGGVSGGVQ